MIKLITRVLILLLINSAVLFSQNQTKKWYFGNYAAMDFMTTPPTALTNNVMYTAYSCASIADAAGNLLFYTDGMTVYNPSHATMANGTGLAGSGTGNSSQGSIIVPRPGSTTQYYIFTTSNNWNSAQGFNYSIVDMSLASGQGSVVAKNVNLFTGYTSGRVTATRHCNGVDIWVVTRDGQGSSTSTSTVVNNFYTYLVTSAGVNTTAIISPGSVYTYSNNWNWYDWGCMKISPNGQQLGLANYNNWSWNMSNNNATFELWNFNNSTGAITNSLALLTTTNTNNWGGWGCEFSPDGTKFYGGRYNTTGSTDILQWDLCAGSPTAIVASAYTVNVVTQVGSLQLAPDGKIYCSKWSVPTLGVINSPNLSGSACNFAASGFTLSPKASTWSLPNFMSSYFIQRPTPTPFTYTVGNNSACWNATFTSLYTPSITVVGCSSSGYSLNAVKWDFGDPNSGSNNISFASNPTHAFSAMGTYSVQLVLYYSCGGGTDTLKQVVNVNQPCISVVSTSITCASLGSATVTSLGGIGPFTYTWMPSGQTNSAATGLSPGIYTITVFDAGNNLSYTASTVFTSLIPLTGNLSYASSVTCHGANTATATVTNLAGGSGSQNFSWYNTTTTLTNTYVNTLSAGIWSVSVIDVLTGCSINQSFYISQPPPQNLVTSAGSPTACVNHTVQLNSTNSGGTPFMVNAPYTYSWTDGAVTPNQTVTANSAGVVVYTLTARDSLNCAIISTVSVNYITNPVITVSNVSICPLQTGVLIPSGAVTYTWNGTTTSTNFSASPVADTQYTVVGTALGCTAMTTAFIQLYPLPVPVFNHNSPVCNGQALTFNGGGGATYQWSGPSGFSVSQQSVSFSPATVNKSGAYTLTVTSVDGCTATATDNLTVHPTPTLSAVGSTVCTNGTLTLFANSVTGANYAWSGPVNFSSSFQNPAYIAPTLAHSGLYTVTATSAQNCTNTAVADVTVTLLPQPVATSDQPKCEGKTLNLAGNGGDQYQWNGPAGFTSSVATPVIQSAGTQAGGTYTLQVTTGPCVNTATHDVVIYPLPTPVASNNGPVCETKKLQLMATTGNSVVTYIWNGPGLKTTGASISRDSSVLNYSGIYTLTVIDKYGCEASATTPVSIIQNPTLSAVGATVCLNQSATLHVSGASSYFWQGPKYYQSGNADAFVESVTLDRMGEYTVRGTAVNGCTSIATVNVDTKVLPVPQLSVSPSTKVCMGQSLTMEAEGGIKYEWYGPSDFYKSGKKIDQKMNHAGFAGTYTLVVSDAMGCFNKQTVFIEVNNLPDGSLSGSRIGCVPLCSDYSFEVTSGKNVTSTWEVQDRISTGDKFATCFYTPGKFLVTGSLSDAATGCVNTITFNVTAYSKPVADFEFNPKEPVEKLDELKFTNTSVIAETVHYHWYYGEEQHLDATSEHLAYLFEKAGTYPVVLITSDEFGCADTVVKNVVIKEDISIYIPDAFTPNNDGMNDFFVPVVSGIKKYKIELFDRWGKKIFDSRTIGEGWDGSFLGEPCKSDVYNWKLTVTTTAGAEKFFNGHVTLVK